MKLNLSTSVFLFILGCLAIVAVCHMANWNTSTVFTSGAIGFVGGFAVLAGLSVINSFDFGYPLWLNNAGAVLVTIVALFVYSQIIAQLNWNPQVAWGWLAVGIVASLCGLLYTVRSAATN